MEPGCSQYLQMGKTRVCFFPPGPLIQDLNKNIALVRIRFVGDGSTVHCPLKSSASYEKNQCRHRQ